MTGASRPERANILVADDSHENLLAVEQILEPLGHNVVMCTSGEDVLRRLLLDEFAVILLDVRMPGMDGLQTAAQIKQREKTSHIPIIFLTAVHQAPNDVLKGYSAGAVDYLAKPFEPWVLLSKVAVFLDIYLAHKQAEELSRQLSAAEVRRHHALELNEGIVQGLVVTKLALELGEPAKARAALENTLVTAKRVIGHLLGDGRSRTSFRPGDFRSPYKQTVRPVERLSV